MWLEILIEAREKLGYSYKYIAEQSKTSEKTVTRLFSGSTKAPPIDTVHRIASVLNIAPEDLFADSRSVVGGKHYIDLQEENEALTKDVEKLNTELALVSAENAILKDKVVTLSAENELLRLKIEHKEEIIALHNYYINRKVND